MPPQMKILVTGCAGFIGSHFTRYWINTHPQDSIIGLDKLTYAGNLENLKELEDNPRYTFVKGDITDASLVETLMRDVDIVVHFAAETHVDRSIINPEPFIMSNVVGTYVLLEAARRYNVSHFHHISTDEVFGTLPLTGEDKFNESTPYNPSSPYSATKASSDHLVRAYHITYGLPITISNCSNNYGSYMYPEKLIPLSITNAIENKKIPLHGDGSNIRDWIYVIDHIKALECIIQKGKDGETYLIGGLEKGISNLNTVQEILKLMGKDIGLIEFVKDRQGNDLRYDVDWSKLRTLGWEPTYSFKEGLVKTIEWYQDNQEWWRKLKTI